MSDSRLWVPSFSEEDFNKRMDNAFRRVSGSIGFDLAMDRGNTKALRASAGQAFESGMDQNLGPRFVRMGKSALDMAGYRPDSVVDMKNCAGEILREFYEEGTAAYHAAAAALRADALGHMRGLETDSRHCDALLSSADSVFAMPAKDDFTSAAQELCKEPLAPSTLAILAGGAVFIGVVLLLRSPVVAGIAGLCAGGAMYYQSRRSRREKVARMLRVLPARLYDLLHARLKTNVRRYAETVNAGLDGAGPA